MVGGTDFFFDFFRSGFTNNHAVIATNVFDDGIVKAVSTNLD